MIASTAPPHADQPIDKLFGCHMTNVSVSRNMITAKNMVTFIPRLLYSVYISICPNAAKRVLRSPKMAELSPAYLHDTVLLFFLVAVCRHHLIGRERPPLIHALENRRGENKKPLLSAFARIELYPSGHGISSSFKITKESFFVLWHRICRKVDDE
ncbi:MULTISPECIES: hypothetical protein [Bacillus]|uniref:hypothetical protein n=1 Tax=Bacillus TaxID=1386 RepID=UPI00158303DF|nr:hypothetical protein [Bacillus glycinifermentans]MBU8785123.1 hypothetical protein [Bacillus glycinifermentans]